MLMRAHTLITFYLPAKATPPIIKIIPIISFIKTEVLFNKFNTYCVEGGRKKQSLSTFQHASLPSPQLSLFLSTLFTFMLL